jgi:hypothetical protein
MTITDGEHVTIILTPAEAIDLETHLSQLWNTTGLSRAMDRLARALPADEDHPYKPRVFR